MTKRNVGYWWRLREVMAAFGHLEGAADHDRNLAGIAVDWFRREQSELPQLIKPLVCAAVGRIRHRADLPAAVDKRVDRDTPFPAELLKRAGIHSGWQLVLDHLARRGVWR